MQKFSSVSMVTSFKTFTCTIWNTL